MTDKLKKKRNTYNNDILKRLEEKFGYGYRYITLCLSDTNNQSEMAEVFRKEYNEMSKAVTELLKTM